MNVNTNGFNQIGNTSVYESGWVEAKWGSKCKLQVDSTNKQVTLVTENIFERLVNAVLEPFREVFLSKKNDLLTRSETIQIPTNVKESTLDFNKRICSKWNSEISEKMSKHWYNAFGKKIDLGIFKNTRQMGAIFTQIVVVSKPRVLSSSSSQRLASGASSVKDGETEEGLSRASSSSLERITGVERGLGKSSSSSSVKSFHETFAQKRQDSVEPSIDFQVSLPSGSQSQKIEKKKDEKTAEWEGVALRLSGDFGQKIITKSMSELKKIETNFAEEIEALRLPEGRLDLILNTSDDLQKCVEKAKVDFLLNGVEDITTFNQKVEEFSDELKGLQDQTKEAIALSTIFNEIEEFPVSRIVEPSVVLRTVISSFKLPSSLEVSAPIDDLQISKRVTGTIARDFKLSQKQEKQAFSLFMTINKEQLRSILEGIKGVDIPQLRLILEPVIEKIPQERVAELSVMFDEIDKERRGLTEGTRTPFQAIQSTTIESEEATPFIAFWEMVEHSTKETSTTITENILNRVVNGEPISQIMENIVKKVSDPTVTLEGLVRNLESNSRIAVEIDTLFKVVDSKIENARKQYADELSVIEKLKDKYPMLDVEPLKKELKTNMEALTSLEKHVTVPGIFWDSIDKRENRPVGELVQYFGVVEDTILDFEESLSTNNNSVVHKLVSADENRENTINRDLEQASVALKEAKQFARVYGLEEMVKKENQDLMTTRYSLLGRPSLKTAGSLIDEINQSEVRIQNAIKGAVSHERERLFVQLKKVPEGFSASKEIIKRIVDSVKKDLSSVYPEKLSNKYDVTRKQLEATLSKIGVAPYLENMKKEISFYRELLSDGTRRFSENMSVGDLYAQRSEMKKRVINAIDRVTLLENSALGAVKAMKKFNSINSQVEEMLVFLKDEGIGDSQFLHQWELEKVREEVIGSLPNIENETIERLVDMEVFSQKVGDASGKLIGALKKMTHARPMTFLEQLVEAEKTPDIWTTDNVAILRQKLFEGEKAKLDGVVSEANRKVEFLLQSGMKPDAFASLKEAMSVKITDFQRNYKIPAKESDVGDLLKSKIENQRARDAFISSFEKEFPVEELVQSYDRLELSLKQCKELVEEHPDQQLANSELFRANSLYKVFLEDTRNILPLSEYIEKVNDGINVLNKAIEDYKILGDEEQLERLYQIPKAKGEYEVVFERILREKDGAVAQCSENINKLALSIDVLGMSFLPDQIKETIKKDLKNQKDLLEAAVNQYTEKGDLSPKGLTTFRKEIEGLVNKTTRFTDEMKTKLESAREASKAYESERGELGRLSKICKESERYADFYDLTNLMKQSEEKLSGMSDLVKYTKEAILLKESVSKANWHVLTEVLSKEVPAVEDQMRSIEKQFGRKGMEFPYYAQMRRTLVIRDANELNRVLDFATGQIEALPKSAEHHMLLGMLKNAMERKVNDFEANQFIKVEDGAGVDAITKKIEENKKARADFLLANRFPIANFKEIIEVHGEKTRPEALLMEEPVRTFMENVALIKDEFKAFTSSLGVEHKSEFLELVTDKADELENLYLDIVREGFNTWSVSGESDKKQEIARLVEAGTNYIERLRDIVASVTQASVNYKEVKNALLRLKDRCDNSHNYAASYALEKLLKENEVKFPPLNSVGNVVKYGKIATQLAEALDKGVKKISKEDSSARDQMSLMEEMYGDGVVSSEQYQKLRDIFLKEIKTKIDNTIREESAKIRQLNGVPQASEFIEKAKEKFKILKELKDEKIQKSGVEAIVNYEDRVNDALMTDPFEGAPENY